MSTEETSARLERISTCLVRTEVYIHPKQISVTIFIVRAAEKTMEALGLLRSSGGKKFLCGWRHLYICFLSMCFLWVSVRAARKKRILWQRFREK